MGVKNLLQVLKSSTKKVHLRDYAGKRLGIDGMCWIHRGLCSCSKEILMGIKTDKYVRFFISMIKLLEKYGIECLVVFDGCPLPIKATTAESRRQERERNKVLAIEALENNQSDEAEKYLHRCVKVTGEMISEVIDALRKRGTDFMVAPYEADGQLAYLNQHRYIDAVVTEDSDLLAFGCHCVLFKLDKDGNCDEVCRGAGPGVATVMTSDAFHQLFAWKKGSFTAPSAIAITVRQSVVGADAGHNRTNTNNNKQGTPIVNGAVGKQGTPIVNGAVGLTNLGNTCFMASMLQCLSNTSLLRSFFISDAYKSDVNACNPLGFSGKIAKTYAELMKDMWSGTYTVCAPSDFKKTIGEFQSQYKGNDQQDSQEFMSFLLDGLHEDLNRILKKPYVQSVEGGGRPDIEVAQESWSAFKLRNDSKLVDSCFGQLRSRVTCKCGHVSVKFDEFSSVSLPIPESTDITADITDCLTKFSAEEQMLDSETFQCSKCQS